VLVAALVAVAVMDIVAVEVRVDVVV